MGEWDRPTISQAAARSAVTAFLLAPVAAELLSGSLPPAEFFHPARLLLVVPLYGCGCLMAHEVAATGRGGWVSVLLAGAGMGLLSEGFGAGSLTSPDWVTIGPLAYYGRIGGVNWIWSLYAIGHFVLFGVALPLLVAGIYWPAAAGRPWLDGPARGLVGATFLAVVLASALLRETAVPPRAMLIEGLLAAGLLQRARTRRRVALPPARPMAPWRVFVQTTVTYCLLLATGLALPESKIPMTPALLVLLVWCGGIARRLARRVAAGWTPRHHAALIWGLALPPALLTFWQEADPARPDDPSGMVAVGLVCLLALWHLRRRAARSSSVVGAGAPVR